MTKHVLERRIFPVNPSFYPGNGKVEKARQAKIANGINVALNNGDRVFGKLQAHGVHYEIERVTRVFHYSLECDTTCGRSVIVDWHEILPAQHLTHE